MTTRQEHTFLSTVSLSLFALTAFSDASSRETRRGLAEHAYKVVPSPRGGWRPAAHRIAIPEKVNLARGRRGRGWA